jgi:hypothetical protein
MANNGEPRDPIVLRADDEQGNAGSSTNADDVKKYNAEADKWYAEVDKNDNDIDYIEPKKAGPLMKIILPILLFILFVSLCVFVYVKKTSAPSPESQYANYPIPYPNAEGPGAKAVPSISHTNAPAVLEAASGEAASGSSDGSALPSEAAETVLEASGEVRPIFAPAVEPVAPLTPESETLLPPNAPDPASFPVADGGDAFTGSGAEEVTGVIDSETIIQEPPTQTIETASPPIPDLTSADSLGSAPGITNQNLVTGRLDQPPAAGAGSEPERPLQVPLEPEKVQKASEATALQTGRPVNPDTVPALESPAASETGAAEDKEKAPASPPATAPAENAPIKATVNAKESAPKASETTVTRAEAPATPTQAEEEATPSATTQEGAAASKDATATSETPKKPASYKISIFSNEKLEDAEKKLAELRPQIKGGTLYIGEYKDPAGKIVYRIYYGFFSDYDLAKKTAADLEAKKLAASGPFVNNATEEEVESHGGTLITP